MVNEYRVVYSTDGPTECPTCKKKLHKCSCIRNKEINRQADGIVTVHRETKRRGGKVVTVLTGFSLASDKIREILSDLKTKLGCGGTIKGATIELQGDRIEFALKALRERGISAKRSGG
jgi:translation initiation factor 1